MKRFKYIFLSIFGFLFGIVALLFGLLNIPSVQESIKERIVTELKIKLDTELEIEKLHFRPFNEIELKGVKLYDRKNAQALYAERLYAHISLYPLLKKEVIITSIRLNNFDINLSKINRDSTLNIQFVIDAFKSDDEEKKTSFEVKINSLNLSDGKVRFDIQDQPNKQNVFDPNHIAIFDFNANMALKSLKGDSLNIQVKRLSLKEKNGFEINNLIARLTSKDKSFQIKGFRLELPNSLLQFGKSDMEVLSNTDSQTLFDNIRFDLQTGTSYITPKDFVAFLPKLKKLNDRIFLQTKISGTLNDFQVANFSLDYENKLNLITTASVKNLSNKENLYLSGNIKKLDITTQGIHTLFENISDNGNTVPKELLNLGTISFQGDISGFLKKLQAKGLIKTQLGEITTDLLFGFKPESNIDSYFDGKIHTVDFDLGRLTENKDLEKLSLDVMVDLIKPSNKKLGGKVEGEIFHFDYKGYPYQNITVNGNFEDSKITGEANVDDENIYLDIEGMFDLSKEQPEMDFIARLKNLRSDKLNLTDKYPGSYLSLLVNANFTGKDIDNLEGRISVDSVSFYKAGQQLTIENFTIEASGEASDKKLKINSDFINGEIVGSYSFSSIANSLKNTFHSYFPSLIPVSATDTLSKNNFSLDITIKNTEKISEILSLPFTVFSEAKILGYYNNRINDKIRLEVFYPSGKVAGMTMKSGYVLVDNPDDKLNSYISAIITGKNNVQNDVSLEVTAKDDALNATLSFINNSKQKFNGTIKASALFSHNPDSHLMTEINIEPGNLTINDTIWQVDKSKIELVNNEISVENFNIHNIYRDQSININGKFSKSNPEDMLAVNLNSINLQYVFNTLAIDALNFSGAATGVIECSTIDGNAYLDVNLDVQNFGFNNTRLGHLTLYSELDEVDKKAKMNGLLVTDDGNKTEIEGTIDPATQELSIDFDADRINVGFLNKYVSTLFNDVSGIGSGKVRLYGDFSNVTVTGKAFIENGSLGINFLNTRYNFTDTIYMKEDLIYFNNVVFYDQFRNKANISGKVVHDFFSNFMYYVELSGENFMLYNGTEKMNPMFFGQAFGSGTGVISGDEQAMLISAQLKTEKNTLIRMNFMEETVSSYSFITYKDSNQQFSDSITGQLNSSIIHHPAQDSEMEIKMDFRIEATPEATIELVMDPVGGDILKGAGNGSMQFNWDMKNDPKLRGTYVIDKGSYNFTFQKIIERKFTIRSGSSVLFNGDPFQANLDVSAVYRVHANLNDLDKNLVATTNTGQASIPVECILNITGPLRHPNLKMDIELPTADAEVQRQVKSFINNEDMMNRQMVYLLLLSKFYTPNYADDEHKSNDFASLASATLSTQLSKILSTIDERWQFGTHIRTSDSKMTSTEIELLLSSQLFNDRLLINGNFGYRDNPQTTKAFITDIDIELLLNPVGTWRLKAFNHANDKYFKGGDLETVQKQGLGIVYKKNFDNLREFFGVKKEEPAHQDTVIPLLPDSTIKGSELGDFIRIKND